MALEVTDNVAGDLLALVIGRSHGADLGQQGCGLSGVEADIGTTGAEVAQQDMQAVDPAGVLGDQVVEPS